MFFYHKAPHRETSILRGKTKSCTEIQLLCYGLLFEIVISVYFQVHIINLLQDSKFQHFKPVMDTYIESHFAGALSYRYVTFSAFDFSGCDRSRLQQLYTVSHGQALREPGSVLRGSSTQLYAVI